MNFQASTPSQEQTSNIETSIVFVPPTHTNVVDPPSSSGQPLGAQPMTIQSSSGYGYQIPIGNHPSNPTGIPFPSSTFTPWGKPNWSYMPAMGGIPIHTAVGAGGLPYGGPPLGGPNGPGGPGGPPHAPSIPSGPGGPSGFPPYGSRGSGGPPPSGSSGSRGLPPLGGSGGSGGFPPGGPSRPDGPKGPGGPPHIGSSGPNCLDPGNQPPVGRSSNGSSSQQSFQQLVYQSTYGPTGTHIPYKYYQYVQPNLHLPFLETSDFSYLSKLINDPFRHNPSWPTISVKSPSDIPKFNGKQGDDPKNHVMTFHLWCSSSSSPSLSLFISPSASASTFSLVVGMAMDRGGGEWAYMYVYALIPFEFCF